MVSITKCGNTMVNTTQCVNTTQWHTRELRHIDQVPLQLALQKNTIQFSIDFLTELFKENMD